MTTFLRKSTSFISIFIVSACLFVSVTSKAQNRVNGEAIEELWQNSYTTWRQNLQNTVHASNRDFALFFQYDQEAFYSDRSAFFQKASTGTMNNVQAKSFFAQLNVKYLSLYNTFLTIKADYPNTLAEYTTGRSLNPGSVSRIMNTCNTACYNVDCSNGTLNGWNAYYAINQSTSSATATSALTGGAAGAVTRAAQDPNTGNSYQVSLLTGNGVDPVCGTFIPVMPPLGNYSIRIGDSTQAGFGVGEATYSFIPTGPNPKIAIQYALVLESINHVGWTRPWFSMEVLDSVGNPIPGCGEYTVVSAPGTPGFQGFFYPGSGDTVYCRPWTTVFVNLSSYVGHCCTLSFESSDCAFGAHFGYAYIAASCSNPVIASSSNFFCGQSTITLTAPPGGQTYSWTGPCITGATNQQQCTITCPGTYSVTLTSSAGPTCGTTMTITIGTAPGPPPVPNFTADTVCSGNPTQFTDLSNPLNGPGVTTYWDFYNNFHFEDSTITNPTWTFPQGGAYQVHVHEVSNGCGADTTITIIVDSSISPNISGSTQACVGQQAFFANSSGGGSFTWNFGDPNCPPAQNTSTLQFPHHIYSVAGTYTVSLSKGGHCPASDQLVITVTASPTESISYNMICGSNTVTFHADDSTNMSFYDWSFNGSLGNVLGGTFSVSSASTTFTFPASNSCYEVTVTATPNAGFCPGTFTLNFCLNPGADTARFDTVPPSCVGQTIHFRDSSEGGPNQWRWNFGDPNCPANQDTSSKENPTHKYSQPGVYTVKLVVDPSVSCKDSTTRQITINPLAVADFNANSVCLVDSVDFINSSFIIGGTITGYVWNFDDPGSGPNNTSVLQNPAHKYATQGAYVVSLTALTASGCDSTITQTITVYPGGPASFANSKACIGAATQFTDNTQVASGTEIAWNWNFGDGGTSTLQDPTHTYTTVGSYQVKLSVTVSTGCIDTVIQTVWVSPNPVALFSSDTLFGCAPLCVQFADHSTLTSGNLVKWNWSMGSASTDTSSSKNPFICYNTGGLNTVSLTVTSDSGCVASSTINNMINVYGKPKAVISASGQTISLLLNPTVTYTSSDLTTGDSLVSYLWRFADTMATSTNLTRTYTDTGTFCGTLVLTNKHVCIDSTSDCVTVQPTFSFYIPSAFTPNGNGLNDIFKPEGMYIKSFEMYIFNRWGQLLFHSSDQNLGWDGTASGSMCGEDTYVYNIKITDTQGHNHTYIGSVNLLR